MRLGFVLHTDFDEFEGDDDKGFGGSGGGARQDGKGLVHLGDTEGVAVEFAPFIVGGEFGGSGVSLVTGGLKSLQGLGRTSLAPPSGWGL